MLLTMDDMRFLAKTTEQVENGKLKAKQKLTKAEKERLLEIDEYNVMCNEEHLIVNHEELKY